MSARRLRWRRAAWGVAILGVPATFALLLASAVRTVPGNSDGATVALEGQAIAEGHLLLHGWTLSLDSFWTVDALFYAAADAIDGLRGALVTVVPAVIATLVVAMSVVLARADLRGRAAVVAAVVIVGLLALPTRAFAAFFVQGPFHVGSVLYCLIAFAGIRSGRLGRGFAVAVVALAAGILGDFQTVVLGAAPMFVAGMTAALRGRRWRDGRAALAAAPASVLLAFVVHLVVAAFGGFTLTKSNPVASGHQILRNLRSLPGDVLGLFGITAGPFGRTFDPPALRAVHVVGLLLVLVAVGTCVFRLWRGIRRGDETPETENEPWRLDDLLAAGVSADLATFILFPIIDSSAYARYLTAGVVFGSILAARMVGRYVAAHGHVRVEMRIAAVAVVVVYAASFGATLRAPVLGSPVSRLISFLSSKGLTRGVGDYWSSSLVTLDSGGRIAVRPVVKGPSGLLVRYEKQSTASWYAGAHFSFFVYNKAVPWNGVGRKIAVHTFGQPATTYDVGTYRVLAYPNPIVVSPVGSEGP